MDDEKYPQHDQKSAVMYMVIVGILWGLTNPLMKRGARGIESVGTSSKLRKFFEQIFFLVTNVKYLLPFLINQCGSILYISNLGIADLSLSVPVTNSLTFAFTAITGWTLNEEKLHKNVYAGIFLIIIGTMLCCLEKFIAVN